MGVRTAESTDMRDDIGEGGVIYTGKEPPRNGVLRRPSITIAFSGEADTKEGIWVSVVPVDEASPAGFRKAVMEAARLMLRSMAEDMKID